MKELFEAVEAAFHRPGTPAYRDVGLVVWGGVMLDLWQTRSPWGISAGVWGLAVNFALCALGAMLTRTGRAA